jgi:anaphase-promoting complex subunit 2
VGADVDDHIFTVVDSMSDVNKNSIVNESSEAFQMNEDEDESSIASVEEQLKKEMTVYEVGLLPILFLQCSQHTCFFVPHFSVLYNLTNHSTHLDALQKFIIGMLTNFGNMTLDKIHNTLKVEKVYNLVHFRFMLLTYFVSH